MSRKVNYSKTYTKKYNKLYTKKYHGGFAIIRERAEKVAAAALLEKKILFLKKQNDRIFQELNTSAEEVFRIAKGMTPKDSIGYWRRELFKKYQEHKSGSIEDNINIIKAITKKFEELTKMKKDKLNFDEFDTIFHNINVNELENKKENSKAAANAKAKEEQAKAEEARKVAEANAEEEARKVAEATAAEEARKVAEENAAEEARKVAEENAAEEARKVAEATAAEEARKAAEAKAEEARKAAEAKAAEEARKVAEATAEEARKVAEEQARKNAEEAKKVAEEQAKNAANKQAAQEAKNAANKQSAQEAKNAANKQSAQEAKNAANKQAAQEAKNAAEEGSVAEEANSTQVVEGNPAPNTQANSGKQTFTQITVKRKDQTLPLEKPYIIDSGIKPTIDMTEPSIRLDEENGNGSYTIGIEQPLTITYGNTIIKLNKGDIIEIETVFKSVGGRSKNKSRRIPKHKTTKCKRSKRKTTKCKTGRKK